MSWRDSLDSRASKTFARAIRQCSTTQDGAAVREKSAKTKTSSIDKLQTEHHNLTSNQGFSLYIAHPIAMGTEARHANHRRPQ